MRLAADGFIKHSRRFTKPDGESREIAVYSYVAGNGLYDICIWDGEYCYQKNSGGYSHDKIEPIHKAILKHYSL